MMDKMKLFGHVCGFLIMTGLFFVVVSAIFIVALLLVPAFVLWEPIVVPDADEIWLFTRILIVPASVIGIWFTL